MKSSERETFEKFAYPGSTARSPRPIPSAPARAMRAARMLLASPVSASEQAIEAAAARLLGAAAETDAPRRLIIPAPGRLTVKVLGPCVLS